jgi:hypothetical protein
VGASTGLTWAKVQAEGRCGSLDEFRTQDGAGRGGALFWDFHRGAFSQTVCLQREGCTAFADREPWPVAILGAEAMGVLLSLRHAVYNLWWNSAQREAFQASWVPILFIGVRDNGMPEVGVNLEKLQQSFTLKMQAAYPPIYFTTRILEKDGAQFLAVIVPGSPSRPHFAGQAYVRNGNRTEAASEQEFEELLASRLSKSAEILKWITKTVTLTWLRTENTHVLGSVISEAPVFVTACNSFYVTYADQVGRTGNSIPLRRVEVSYDNANSRLKLEIYPA